MNRRQFVRRATLVAMLSLVGAPANPAIAASGGDTFTRSEVVAEAEKFFGKGAKGLAGVLEKAFEKQPLAPTDAAALYLRTFRKLAP